ncbi:hypothetical protein [Enterobacter kobei]|uniref:hypothetical protein n=1 Tax=Enterobacter kobei TaxID=208224 RepID=UPI003CF7C9E6
MNFLRLPSSLNGATTSWSCGRGDELILLYPGDVLLSESVAIPSGLKGKKRIRQWMQANPEVCQWNPDKEKLLFLHSDGEYCHYWAVSHALWLYWCSLMPGHCMKRWIPDWMLLPPPVNGGVSALQMGDTILFRHSAWCGGTLPVAMAELFTPLQPRWFSLSTKEAGYPLSRTFCRNQVRTHGRYLNLWPGPVSVRRMPAALLAISLAFCVAQTAEFGWLLSTRISPDSMPKPALPVFQEHSAFPGAMSLLNDIQQQGPVKLEEMTLHSHHVQYALTSELPCPTLKARLRRFRFHAEYRQREELCRIKIEGNV